MTLTPMNGISPAKWDKCVNEIIFCKNTQNIISNLLKFTEEVPCVQVFGPGPNLLPDAFGRIVFADETAIFQDLVLKKRRRVSENDQIDIPLEPAGQSRLQPESFAAGDLLFCDDRQIDIAAPPLPSGRRRSENIDSSDVLSPPEYGGQVLHVSVPFHLGLPEGQVFKVI
jgi:hypothetical protein